jgi:hypothetical protein
LRPERKVDGTTFDLDQPANRILQQALLSEAQVLGSISPFTRPIERAFFSDEREVTCWKGLHHSRKAPDRRMRSTT